MSVEGNHPPQTVFLSYRITAQHLRDPRKSLRVCHCERSFPEGHRGGVRSSLLYRRGIASAQNALQ